MTTNDQLALLNTVYRSLEPLLDFFMPTMKLVSKVRIGSKEIRKYDEPVSLYHRLMNSPALTQEVKGNLQQLCHLYNPVLLQHNVNRKSPPQSGRGKTPHVQKFPMERRYPAALR
jgi:hypothetical protein